MYDASAGQPLVELHGVTLHFGDKAVLDDLSLSVSRGERLVLMGPSGTGKSTLLKLLVATLPPEKGSIRLLGQEITKLQRRELNEMRTHVGVVYQYSALISSSSVHDNLALPLEELTDKAASEVDETVNDKLRIVGLPETVGLMPDQLSGGMRKRVAVARALMLEPDLMLFDEPTAGLDPVACSVIDELIVNLNERMHTTEIVVTHEMESALKVATRIALLHEGKIVFDGTPDEFRDSNNPIVVQFLNRDPHGPVS